jgi:hypothetical protein
MGGAPPGLDGYGDRVAPVIAAAGTGTTKLVRPDAYIAWAADNATGPVDTWQEATDQRTDQIREALARWCGEPARPAVLP